MIAAPAFRPKLRSLEQVLVPEHAGRLSLTLRDTEGIAPRAVMIPAELATVIPRFNGARTVEQIAADASLALGRPITASLVADLARELDEAFLLETPRFHARKREVMDDFRRAVLRPAIHAGGAYHADAGDLARYIDEECLAQAPSVADRGRLVGLCAPHMDLWRAAVGYGHAYRALAEALPAEVDTVVLLGTCHAGMRLPFAVCDKAFDTPFGPLAADHALIEALARKSRFDIRGDEFRHKKEHSLELQAIFLRHLFRQRFDTPGHDAPPVTIVPILCGLGEAQYHGRDPSDDVEIESFLDALRALLDARAGRTLLVAGADLAHVGPRFGDARPLDPRERRALEASDRETISLAISGDAPGLFAQVSADRHSRRVCGLGPMYTLLRLLPEARGEALHYAQCVDPEEGSIVSHASLGYSV
ncbi:MAG: AmmeMemoRadiSam system protein B [Minicystis sp.]